MTATKKARKTREKRPKQQFLDGMEPPRIKAIDDAADTYYSAMLERQRLTKEEDDAKINLLEKMKEQGLDRYETPDGLIVVVLSKSNVKCKKKPEPETNGESEE
jgi:hypothetical protein